MTEPTPNPTDTPEQPTVVTLPVSDPAYVQQLQVFQTGDALLKSQRDMQARATRAEQDNAELRRQLQAFQTPQEPGEQPAPTDAGGGEPKSGVGEEAQPGSVADEPAVTQYSDWGDFTPDMLEQEEKVRDILDFAKNNGVPEWLTEAVSDLFTTAPQLAEQVKRANISKAQQLVGGEDNYNAVLEWGRENKPGLMQALSTADWEDHFETLAYHAGKAGVLQNPSEAKPRPASPPKTGVGSAQVSPLYPGTPEAAQATMDPRYIRGTPQFDQAYHDAVVARFDAGARVQKMQGGR